MLNLNLFHEIQRAEFERRWDPVKIAVVVFVVGGVVLGILSGIRWLGYRPSRALLASYQKELEQNEKAHEQADMRLQNLPLYQTEFALMKRRAENKALKSRDLEVFKACIPTNLFVKKLAVDRQVESKKVEGPKNKKGVPTFVIKTSSFNVLRFEASYTARSKPAALEERDRLVKEFGSNEILQEIAAQAAEGSGSVNKVKLASFSTTEPQEIEPAVATIGIEVELKQPAGGKKP